MAVFDGLAPSSALQLTRFTDVDAFRPAEALEDSRSIPFGGQGARHEPASIHQAEAALGHPHPTAQKRGASVALCARAQSFHHLGEFAAAYRATSQESPSDMLARARQGGLSATL